MGNRFTKENYRNIQSRFTAKTGVSFERKVKHRGFRSVAKTGIVYACLLAACIGVFATDPGKNLLEMAGLRRPVAGETISMGFSEQGSRLRTPQAAEGGDASETPASNAPVQLFGTKESSADACIPEEESASADFSYAARGEHPAVDLPCDRGTPVYPVLPGIVAETGWDADGGNFIVLEHEEGYISVYRALETILVEPEQEVDTETQIGAAGSTGKSTGPHLHLELTKNGVPVDPTPYLDSQNQGPDSPSCGAK